MEPEGLSPSGQDTQPAVLNSGVSSNPDAASANPPTTVSSKSLYTSRDDLVRVKHLPRRRDVLAQIPHHLLRGERLLALGLRLGLRAPPREGLGLVGFATPARGRVEPIWHHADIPPTGRSAAAGHLDIPWRAATAAIPPTGRSTAAGCHVDIP